MSEFYNEMLDLTKELLYDFEAIPVSIAGNKATGCLRNETIEVDGRITITDKLELIVPGDIKEPKELDTVIIGKKTYIVKSIIPKILGDKKVEYILKLGG